MEKVADAEEKRKKTRKIKTRTEEMLFMRRIDFIFLL